MATSRDSEMAVDKRFILLHDKSPEKVVDIPQHSSFLSVVVTKNKCVCGHCPFNITCYRSRFRKLAQIPCWIVTAGLPSSESPGLPV